MKIEKVGLTFYCLSVFAGLVACMSGVLTLLSLAASKVITAYTVPVINGLVVCRASLIVCLTTGIICLILSVKIGQAERN